MPLITSKVACTVAVPAWTQVTSPLELTVATEGAEVVQVASEEMLSDVLPVYRPSACSCTVLPAWHCTVAGLREIESNDAAVTVIVAVPVTLPCVAVMVVTPIPALVARPPLLITATDVVPELHATVLVRFCVERSVNVPTALNCVVPPSGTVGASGVTAIETSVAGVTVSDADPETEPSVALIVDVPLVSAVAVPVTAIVATAGAEELHETSGVMIGVVPSEYWP